MQLLKQSTAATVKMGPFLDSTDGNTEETGLTIAQASIRLSKNGGAYAQTHNAAGATHDELGNYGVPLDTTDTGTLGRLRVYIHVAGALAVWDDFMVLPANVFDSLVSGTDVLQADLAQLLGTAPTEGAAGRIAASLTKFGDVAVPAFTAACANQTGDAYAVTNGRLPAALTANGNIKASLIEMIGTVLTEGAGQIAAAFKKFFNVAAPTGTVNSIPDAVAGAAGGIAIVGSVMGKSAATLAAADVTGNLPAEIKATADIDFSATQKTSITAAVPTAAANADAVWDEALGGHAGAGSAGQALSAAGAAADPLLSAVPGAYAAGTAGYIIGTNLDATVSSRTKPADTQAAVTNLTNAPTVGDFTAAMKASITAAVPTAAIIADAVLDEAGATHTGLIPTNLDARVSQVSVTGGDATAANQTLILAAIAAISGGTGAQDITLAVQLTDGTLVADVDVVIRATNDHTAAAVATGKSDASGIVQPHPQLDAGTYYVWRSKAGVDFTNPQTITVV